MQLVNFFSVNFLLKTRLWIPLPSPLYIVVSAICDDVSTENLEADADVTAGNDKVGNVLSNEGEVSVNIGEAGITENNVVDEVEAEEVDEEELKRDKMVEEVLVCAVTKPIEKEKVVEQEIISRFSEIGIRVVKMNTFSDYRGNFDKSRVKVSPVNLNFIWGRQLGLNNCSVIEYYPPPPGWKPRS